MRWPLVWRSRSDADLAAARAETARLRLERDAARTERAAFRTAAVSASEKFTDATIVNDCLTDDLTAAREQLAEYSGRRTVGEVLEEHDVHRKALAAAIDAGLDRNWEQLIAAAARVHKAAGEWMADHEAEKRRADGLQAQLDDALGLNAPAVDAGSSWQDRREQRMKFDKPTAAEEAS
ncbi:hypothetical protein ACFXKI_10030 [Streptomyces mirabilis]|uniref:hypothetical protein n=1 Tax=Streptomyces mirabilis TaxID=68239 RepID=UPI0036AB3F74